MQHSTQQVLVGEEAAITVVRAQPYLDLTSFPSAAIDVYALSNTADLVCFVLIVSGKQVQGRVLSMNCYTAPKWPNCA